MMMKSTEVLKERKVSKEARMDIFEGYLLARLHAIGSRSEGPLYFLQLKTGKEVLVVKKVHPWENDPVLHAWLGEKVAILGKKGKVEEGKPGIEYGRILNRAEPLTLGLKLSIKDDILWVNRMPPASVGGDALTGPVSPPPEYPPQLKNMALYFSVMWPYREEGRSIWKGQCPTSQLFDFRIENPAGETIWQWGACMLFRDEITMVEIPGGSEKEVKAPWFYFEDAITREGVYVASARFIASGQEIRMPFRVKFAHE